MSGREAVPAETAIEPADWPTEPERRYARAVGALADRHGVAVESRVLHTEAAGRIHYLVGGDPDGEPLVLLHGINVCGGYWLPLLPALLEDFRVYVPDRPGGGLSEPRTYAAETLRATLTDYLVDLLDALSMERPRVVGNSLGGLQSFLLALDHDRVGRLGLVGAPAGLTRDFDLLFRLMTARGPDRVIEWLFTRGDSVDNARERAAQFYTVDPSAVSAEFYEMLGAAWDLPGRAESERTLARAESSFLRMHPVFDLTDSLVDLDVPTAFIWGTEDAFWGPDLARDLVASMPEGELSVLEDHGHVPWLEPGDAVRERLMTFLAA